MTTPSDRDVRVHERIPALSAAVRAWPWLSLAGGVAMIAAWLLGHDLLASMLSLSIPFVGFAAALRDRTRSRAWPARTRRARVAVDREGVRVDGRLVVARDRIAGCVWAGGRVRVVDPQRRALVEIDGSEADAEEMATALALETTGRRVVFQGAGAFSRARTIGFAAAIALVAAGAFGSAGASLLGYGHFGTLNMAFLGLLFVAPWLTRVEIEVGADGVLVRGLGLCRFFANADVAEVEPRATGAIRLVLRGGEKIDLAEQAVGIGVKLAGPVATRGTLAERVERALATFREHAAHRVLASQLARGGRDADRWRADLDALAKAEGTYRDATVRDEDLWRVLEDAAAPADARAAAAAVLRERGGGVVERASARLRVVAEAVASPQLRVALETAADGEGDALDAFCDEDAARARSR